MKNNRQPSLILKNLKWFTTALLIGCLWFIYFIPAAIAYPDHYWVRSILPFVIFFNVPAGSLAEDPANGLLLEPIFMWPGIAKEDTPSIMLSVSNRHCAQGPPRETLRGQKRRR